MEGEGLLHHSSKFSEDLQRMQRIQQELAEMTALLGLQVDTGSSMTQQQLQAVLMVAPVENAVTNAIADDVQCAAATLVEVAASRKGSIQAVNRGTGAKNQKTAVLPAPLQAHIKTGTLPAPAAVAQHCYAGHPDVKYDPSEQADQEVGHFMYDHHINQHISVQSCDNMTDQQQQHSPGVEQHQGLQGILAMQGMPRDMQVQDTNLTPADSVTDCPVKSKAGRSGRHVFRPGRDGPRRCDNCGIDNAAARQYWRRDPDNLLRHLCNACGLYKHKHGVDRRCDGSGRWFATQVQDLQDIRNQMDVTYPTPLPHPDLDPLPLVSTHSSISSSELLTIDSGMRPSPDPAQHTSAAVTQAAAESVGVTQVAAMPADLAPTVSVTTATAVLQAAPIPAAITPPASLTHAPVAAVLKAPSTCAADPASSTAKPPPAAAAPRQVVRRKRRRRDADLLRECANCRINASSNWRKDPLDFLRVLCNACGLYKAKNGYDRPLSLVAAKLALNAHRVEQQLTQPAQASISGDGYIFNQSAPQPSGYMKTATLPVVAVPLVAVPQAHVHFGTAAPLPQHDWHGSAQAGTQAAVPPAGAVPAVLWSATEAAAMHVSQSAAGQQQAATSAAADILLSGFQDFADSDAEVLTAAAGDAKVAATGVEQFLQTWVTQG